MNKTALEKDVIRGFETQEVTVYLSKSAKRTHDELFRCPTCGCPVAQHNGQIRILKEGQKLQYINEHVRVKCPNKNCDRAYTFLYL
jgi:hypothetical protein